MPSRGTIALIILFWLGCAAWYVSRELAPRWGLEEVPPYHIDLTDEIGTPSITWNVLLDKKRIGLGTTRIRRLDANTFELAGDMRFEKAELLFGAEMRRSSGRNIIDIHGRLKEAEATAVLRLPGGIDLELSFQGTVGGDVMRPDFYLMGKKQTELLGKTEIKLPPNGKVSNPLFPANRLPGLRVGRRWHEPIVHLTGQQASFVQQVSTVEAEVFADQLTWDGKEVECFKIENRAREGAKTQLHSRIWVRQSDGLVLQQEAFLDLFLVKKEITLVREPGRH